MHKFKFKTGKIVVPKNCKNKVFLPKDALMILWQGECIASEYGEKAKKGRGIIATEVDKNGIPMVNEDVDCMANFWEANDDHFDIDEFEKDYRLWKSKC